MAGHAEKSPLRGDIYYYLAKPASKGLNSNKTMCISYFKKLAIDDDGGQIYSILGIVGGSNKEVWG